MKCYKCKKEKAGKNPDAQCRSCANVGRTGIKMKSWKHSKETVEKIRNWHTGKKRKPFTKETRKKMSEAMMGENNPLWKDGKSLARKAERRILMGRFDYKFWRTSVFARDKYTCQRCDIKKHKRLEAHHIKEWIDYPDLRYDIDNGLTLCKKCHILIHKKA